MIRKNKNNVEVVFYTLFSIIFVPLFYLFFLRYLLINSLKTGSFLFLIFYNLSFLFLCFTSARKMIIDEDYLNFIFFPLRSKVVSKKEIIDVYIISSGLLRSGVVHAKTKKRKRRVFIGLIGSYELKELIDILKEYGYCIEFKDYKFF